MFPHWDENRPFAATLLVLIVCSIGFLGAKTVQVIGQTVRLDEPVPYEHTIYVEGIGKVSGKPDIATISFGVETRGKDAAKVQNENTTKMNALLEKVKALGISEDDVQTSSYNVYQDMPWDPDLQKSVPGDWIVNQQVTVKIRDTQKISTVIQTAGQNGATNIYGPNFTIDDPSELKAQAREKALADAQQKAKVIAQSLGLELDKVVGYSEYANDPGYPTPYYAMDKGGGESAPMIQPGTNEVTLTVTVTYTLAE